MPAADYIAIAKQVATDAGLPTGGCDLRQLTGGVANHVYCFDERWTIRLGTGPDGKCFPKSAALLRAVDGRMLAPRVHYTDFSQTRYPWNVMICSYLPGTSLYDSWAELAHADRMRILGAIPEQLQVLYELPCECLAGLHDLSPPVVAIGREFKRLYPAAECKVDPAMLAVMRRYMEDHWAAVEGSPPAVIIHNDVHWNNTLVSEGNFGGLVDFDDAEPGWPEMDAFAMVHLLAAAEAPQELTPLARPESMRRACQVVRHLWTGVLETPGCLERYVISRVIGILGDLAEPPPWHTQEESRQEAEQTWQALFQGLGPGSWFQP